MIVITTHVNADFDCLASMMVACKLYPDAIIIFPGSQEKNVRTYLERSDHHLPIRRLKNFDLSKVTKLVIVDTTSKERLGPFGKLCDDPNIKVEVYDHHPKDSGDITFKVGRIEQRGANTTLMLEIVREKGIPLSPEEATLMMLGIYEDTGYLTFTSTTPEDFRAAEYLLGLGATLPVITEFLQRTLSAEQISMLHELLNRLEYHVINGVEVVVAFAKADRYVGDLAAVIHTLKEMENISALFVIVEMEARLHLIGRSNIAALDASQVAAKFGGGGHTNAASATIRNMLMKEAQDTLINTLEKIIPPAPSAEQMMVAPVVSAGEKESLENVEILLTRQNINSMPVLKSGKPVGIITRQLVEKALSHNLGKSEVRDYMQTEFATIPLNASYENVKDIVIRQRQKIVPVVDDSGKLLGIVGRLDVMRAIYSDFMKSPSTMLHPERKVQRYVARSLTGLMKERLPDEIHKLLEAVGDAASELGFTAYAVGGFVRDLLMRRKNLDLDIVIEGDGIEFAERFVEIHGGRIKTHKKFKTAVMLLSMGKKIDVATARTEYYPEPAALPIVEMSSIKNDLFRRDFTINALAIKLNGKDKNRLIDFFGGQQDLNDGMLRVLHNLSFVEDPTRIFRAIRFSERFHFALGSQTENLLKLAAKKELLNKVSGSRLMGELQNIFKEEHVERATKRIADLGLWRFLQPNIKYDHATHSLVEHAKEAIAWHDLTFEEEKLRKWLVYLYSLSANLTRTATAEFFRRLGFENHPTKHYVEQKCKGWEQMKEFNTLSLNKPVEVYQALVGLEPETLILIMAAVKGRNRKRMVAEFMTTIRNIKPMLSGNDLIKAGMEPGPLLGKVLDTLRIENLKNVFASKEEELAFAKKYYATLKKKITGKN